MRTDDWGKEVQMYLTDLQNEETIWSNWDFGSNQDYTYDACLDPNGCSELEIWDSYGDGYVCGKWRKFRLSISIILTLVLFSLLWYLV
jgi:hypothetical protein